METREIILLNDIIRHIYTIEDDHQFRLYILDNLEVLIPSSTSTFFLSSGDPDKPFCDPISRNVSHKRLMDYVDGMYESDYTRWHFMGGKSIVFRETDIYPENVREGTEYFETVFMEINQYYSAQIGISFGGEFLGVISLFRSKKSGDFTDHELFILDLLKDHLEIRLYRQKNGLNVTDSKQKINTGYYVETYNLTYREAEVLVLLLEGLSYKEICEKLSISPSTTKKHTLNIFKKLDIGHRWELIKIK